MGTRVDCKSYIPGYNNYSQKSMRDLNEDSSSSSWPHYNGIVSRAVADGFPSYEKDAMKQKMLEHETIFRNQVYELHRLYRIQRDMMEEFKRKELYRLQPSLSSNHRPQIQSQDPRKWHMAGFTLINPRVEIENSPMSCTKVYNNAQTSKESEPSDLRPLKVRKRLFDLQLPADEYIDTEESEKRLSDHGIVKLADLNKPVEIEEAMSLSTVAFLDHNSINGVKKSENRDGPLVKSSLNERGWICHPYEAGFSKSNLSSSLHKEKMSVISHPAPGMYPMSSYTRKLATPESRLDTPGNSQTLAQLGEKCIVNGSSNLNAVFRGEISARNGFHQGSASKSSKETNVQLGSHGFWNSSKPVIDINLNEAEERPTTLPWLTDLNQCSSNCKIMSTTKTEAQSVEKTIFQTKTVQSSSEKRSGKIGIDINLECEPPEEEIDIPADELIIEKEMKKQTDAPFLRDYIDLNSCASDFEEGNDSSVKIASGIDLDLEAPVEDETVFHMLQIEKKEIHNAAETMVTISSSCPDNNATLSESITWFVDAVSEELAKDPFPVEEIDDFEEMTLRIPETKGEDCFPEPFVPEEVRPSTSSKSVVRARRGPSRRGRQRRDFQRDILPGLVSLSRHEVTEDIQTFGGLMRATGHHWVSGLARRNGGGKSRRHRAVSESVADVSCSNNRAPMVGQIGNKVVEGGELEDTSLTGWGKRTRRPRRQRFPAGSSNPPAAVLI